MRSLFVGSLGMAAPLLGYAALAPTGWGALPMAFVVTVMGSVLVVNLQLRLMDVAGEAQTLGAAINHASLNVANALGGVGLSLLGFVVLVISAALHRRTPRAA